MKDKMMLPKVGMRIIKTVLAVFICFVIEYLRGGQNPAIVVIAAILCMQQDMRDSFKKSVERVMGTLAGGVLGIIVLQCLDWTGLLEPSIVHYACLAIGLFLMMYLLLLLKRTDMMVIASVMYVSIVIPHRDDQMLHIFMADRLLSTVEGVLVSMAVNALPFLRDKMPPARKQEPPDIEEDEGNWN
ncbi:MAG: FUSC family protein [Christensenellales bacterium]|jgi:uncharacterized membrane protein YgaE (UPF0421/DUF939 family)